MAEQTVTTDLVVGAKEGDDEAYERLFARVQARLLAYIRLRTGRQLAGHVEPMDVLQEAYLQAHKYFPTFDPDHGEGAFLRWMCRIVDNSLRDFAKHFGAKKRTAPNGLRRVSEAGHQVRAGGTGPSTAVVKDEENDRLAEAMQGLDDQEREVLLLRYFQDTPLKEIARQLEIKERTVRTLLGRARHKLGAALERLGGAQ